MSNRRKSRSQRILQTQEVLRIRDEGHRAVREMEKLIDGRHPEKNPMRQLALFRQHAHALLELVFRLSDCNKAYMEMALMETPNNHLAWTQEEDEHLVDARARGEEILYLAMQLGRTPAAVATRLSTLIGVPRNEIVTAYIEGTLDEEPVRGIFHGRSKKVS